MLRVSTGSTTLLIERNYADSNTKKPQRQSLGFSLNSSWLLYAFCVVLVEIRYGLYSFEVIENTVMLVWTMYGV